MSFYLRSLLVVARNIVADDVVVVQLREPAVLSLGRVFLADGADHLCKLFGTGLSWC